MIRQNVPMFYGKECLELWQYTPINTYRKTPVLKIHVFPQLYIHPLL